MSIYRRIPTFLVFSLLFFLFSCKSNNELTILFNDWINIENEFLNTNEIDENLFRKFTYDYEIFKNSVLCQNLSTMGNSEDNEITVEEILCNIDEGIFSRNYGLIRNNIFYLELIDKNLTFSSNQLYLMHRVILFIVIILVTIILLVYLKKYEKKIHQAKQLGIYSNYLIQGIEIERSRISKEIHDTVLQDLKVLNIKADLIKPLPASDEEIKQNLKLRNEIIGITDTSITKLRGICNNLTPSDLNSIHDYNGFKLAVKNLADQFSDKTGITCLLRIQEKVEISSLSFEIITDVFRIIQEALSNIEMHSGAKNASIVISCNNTEHLKKSIKIFITDDGNGFNIKNNRTNNLKKHFGLTNMKERAKNLGATLEIISEPGEGTEIKLEVPIK